MAKKRSKKKVVKRSKQAASPQERMAALAKDAVACSRTAVRHKKSLSGVNFYADKLAKLRADATIAFTALGDMSLGDTSALAELIEIVFAPTSMPKARAEALRDLNFELTTKWRATPAKVSFNVDGGVLPLDILQQTGRGYLISVGRQANGSYDAGYFDGAAVMMRRLLETSIIEAFEAKGIDGNIKDNKGQFFQLTQLIEKALSESSWNLPRNVKTHLGELRDLGHRSAHNRYYLAKKADIDKHLGVYRESVEAFLHIASML